MQDLKYHEYANIFPMMSEEEYQALKADIQEHGLIEPIEYYRDKIIDGRNRYKACVELKIIPSFRQWLGEEKDLLNYIISKNLHRRHLSESQRAMVGARLANIKIGDNQYTGSENFPTQRKSQAQAAELLNTSDRSIRDAKKVLTFGTPELVKAVEDDEIAVSLAEKATELPPEKQEQFVQEVKQGQKASRAYREIAEEPESQSQESSIQPPESSKPHVANNSGNNEWYTPAEIIEAAREVMGCIDLDPASSELANTVVKAKQFYTIQDNGLDKEWKGTVWLNPPYSTDLIPKFIEKLQIEFDKINIENAIVLVNNATETKWFLALANMASAICFPTGRIRYWGPDGEKNSPLQGQAIIYMGEEVWRFRKQFNKLGWIAACYFKGGEISV